MLYAKNIFPMLAYTSLFNWKKLSVFSIYSYYPIVKISFTNLLISPWSMRLDNSSAAQTLAVQYTPRVKPFCWRLENHPSRRALIVRFSSKWRDFAGLLENSRIRPLSIVHYVSCMYRFVPFLENFHALQASILQETSRESILRHSLDNHRVFKTIIVHSPGNPGKTKT